MKAAWLASTVVFGCSEYELSPVEERQVPTQEAPSPTGSGTEEPTPYQSVDAPYAGEGLDPEAPGERVVVEGEAPVTVRFVSLGASYDQTVSVNGISLFDTRVDAPGAELTVGPFPVGEELVFVDEVFDSGEEWYSGPGDRNRDGQVHVVVGGGSERPLLLGFEDLDIASFGAGDFDDVVLEVDGPVSAAE